MNILMLKNVIKIKDNIIKDLFRLTKEINNNRIKDIKNIFKLKKKK